MIFDILYHDQHRRLLEVANRIGAIGGRAAPVGSECSMLARAQCSAAAREIRRILRELAPLDITEAFYASDVHECPKDNRHGYWIGERECPACTGIVDRAASEAGDRAHEAYLEAKAGVQS